MSSNKGGLADLKRLAREAAARAQAQAAVQAKARAVQARTGRPSPQHMPDAAATSIELEISPQDRALFRRSAGEVEPVDTRNRLLHTPQGSTQPQGTAAAEASAKRTDKARPDAQSTQTPGADRGLSDGDVSHLLCEDGTAYLRTGMGPTVLKKLAQRFWRIDADLDLHGMTIEQARPRLAAFITQCIAYDARCVRVVHGKGYGSPDARPVLRDKVRAWLVGTSDVRAFAQAPERDGGAGATLVLLNIDDRRARDRRSATPR